MGTCIFIGTYPLTRSYRYDPYGTELTPHFDTNPFRYCGEYTDAESGMVYLRARYYDPSVGRFISEDPVKDGGNWYAYCANNPINYKDPSGLWVEGDEKLTPGGQTYTTFYGQKWQEEKDKYDRYAECGDVVGAEIAQINMDKWNKKANDIRSLDADGKVQGRTLGVPQYNQLNTSPRDNTNNLCWATSTAMIASFQLGDTTDRTLAIATAITGSTTVSDYNQPWSWVSTADSTLDLGITVGQTQNSGNLTMVQIQTAIDGGNPFGVLYNDGSSGHWIVGVGSATAPEHDPLVVSNDPWGGVQRIRTYEEFQTCGPNDPRPWAWTAQ